jgi:undecaprenyl-diphosphatase
MVSDRRRALRVSCYLLVLAVLLALAVWVTAARSVLQVADDAFLQLMEWLRIGPVVTIAKSITFLGDVWATWLIRGAVLAILTRRRQWLHLAAFSLAVVSSEALIGTMKGLFDRPRPLGSLIATSGASFPSGHAIAAAVTAVGLVIVLIPAGHRRWAWERHAALYASLMALSRTYLGAHWLSDVITGGLLGSALAIGWPALLTSWRARLQASQACRAAEQVPT